MAEITRFPSGGLNLDDSVEIMSPEDWSYAANIISGRSYNRKGGEIENIMGTSLLDSSTWTDGNSKLIGVIRSAEDDTNFLFFYNAVASKHCILKLQEETVSLVLQWSGLNFQNNKLYRINGGGIAGDLLYFTDNFNEPRCVHIARYSDASTPANEEEILHIKRSPLFCPEFDETTFVPTDEKVIDDVQFACQYEYEDGQLSVISPWPPFAGGYGMESVVGGGIDMVPLRIHVTEQVPALVKKLKMVARKGNDGVPFYWHEAEAPFERTLYTYVYTEQNLGTVPSDYLKQFDLVPLTVKSEAVTKSRAWFANYTEGYDTPTSGVTLTFALDNTASIYDEGPTFGPNSRYRLGVVFHDAQGRSCGVMDGNWELTTPLTISKNAIRQHLKYRISGTAPSWAHSYSLVATKDMNKTFFIQGSDIHTTPGSEGYVNVDSDGTETYELLYSNSSRYIRLSTRLLNSVGVYYSFKDGDYALITNTNTGLIYGPLRVRKIDGYWVYVDAVDVGDGPNSYNFQIYTPSMVSEGLYYEIDRRLIVAGSLDSTDYFTLGDCVQRDINGGSGDRYYMPQMRFEPNNGVWNTDTGKPYIKTEIGQVHKRNFIKHSSPFIEGTTVNGLSEFNIGDEGNVPAEAVSVQKLIPTMKEASDGDILLAICNSNTYSIYVGETRMSTNDGSFLVASPEIIGDIRKQRSGFGTLHPESVHEEDGYVYFYDHLSRAFCRYATNGIYPISEYKVVDYFEDHASVNSSADEVLTGYDPFYKMVFVTFKKTPTSNTEKTIGWSTKKERWISFYDFSPNGFSPIAGYITGSKHIYSVIFGGIRMHNNDSEFNTIAGTTYNSVIDLSFNDRPDVPKEWKVLQLNVSPNFYTFSDGNQVIVDPGAFTGDAMRVDISSRHGQETSILYNELEVDENLVYGEIRGDENSTGGILDGDPIYSNTLQARITFSGGTYKQILMAKAGFEPSQGHVL